MATLNLVQTWVNLVADGTGVSGSAALGRSEDYSIPGETRTYVGGRRRTITSAGEVGTFGFQLRLVPRSTVDTLHLWIGKAVQYRDTRGRRVFGTFLDLAVEEVTMLGVWCPPALAASGAWHVGVSLTVITLNEGV